MPSCLSILFRALRIEWRETKRTLFPPTPIEAGLFLFFFLLSQAFQIHIEKGELCQLRNL